MTTYKDCNLARVRARHIIVRALVHEVIQMLITRLSNLATMNSLIGSSIPETIAENILRKCEYAIVRLNTISK
jgi:hypothetical protein